MFLPHLYRCNRPLFWTCVLFIAGSFFSIAFLHQSTPFYLWAMYSTPVPAATEHEFYVLEVNGDARYFTPSCADYRTYFYINSLPAYTSVLEEKLTPPRFATFSRMATRVGLRPDDFLRRVTPDSGAAKAYPAWLHRYVAARMNTSLQRLEVRRIFLRYTSPARVEKVREEAMAVL